MTDVSTSELGTLYVVATPIGNLSDMVPRAVETLQTVDLIAAEDTRHSAKLMQHFDVRAPMQAYHDHNEQAKAPYLIQKLKEGSNIALISDAGTPLISDPGYKLVHQAREAGVRVVPIPGPCALVAALSASGLPSDRFRFEGFLAAKGSQRVRQLSALAGEQATLIFYESSHRILSSLTDMSACFGADRQAVVAREITKQFETFLGGSLAEIVSAVEADANQVRGEFVVMVSGDAPKASRDDGPSQEACTLMALLLEEGIAIKRAATLASKYTGDRKNALYEWAIANK